MDKINIYLAAAYGRRGEMAELAKANPEFNYTSNWMNQPPELPDDGIGGADNPNKYALSDIDDILCCDIFICFSELEGAHARGGKHFETGFAWALGKWCCVVGKMEHMFQAIDNIKKFDTWEECKEWLTSLKTPLGTAFQE